MEKRSLDLISVSCDLCGSGRNKEIYSIPDIRLGDFEIEYPVVECLDCGHRFLSPRPSEEDMPDFYPEEYFSGRDALRNQRGYRRRNDSLPRDSGRILDLGCAGGDWLASLPGEWKKTGVDFIGASSNAADVDILVGELPELDIEDEFFDVVTAWGVMEHVGSPLEYFKKVHRVLKPDGAFVFLVPNSESLWSRWAYKEDVPRHLHFFRKSTLERYADSCGFHVERVEATNRFYSIPATGRGLFKRNVLLGTRLSWERIATNDYGGWRRVLGKFASALDVALIHPALEETFGLAGSLFAIFSKREI